MELQRAYVNARDRGILSSTFGCRPAWANNRARHQRRGCARLT